MKDGEMTGRQKAAVLLISLGPELSAEMYKRLRDDEIERLTLEIAGVRHVEPEVRDAVVDEFHQMCIAQEYISQGGIEYAKEILERALGPQRALDFLHRLTATLQVRPFDFVRKTDPAHLMNFIQNEHPQTIALIMAYLDPDQSSVILSALTPERQADVARRIAIMDRTSPEIIREVEKVLERKLSSLVTEGYAKAGGIEAVVDVLNRVDRGTEKTIMEALEIQDPQLAEDIKRRMFLFEDIIYLDDRYVQRVLRDVDLNRDLPLSLKAASEDLKAKIHKNMSKRAVETLKENIDYLGPVRLRDVEEAQQKIVNLIRKLEEDGEVIIARGGGDEIIV
jgi:flagellar motor switch protein FliG